MKQISTLFLFFTLLFSTQMFAQTNHRSYSWNDNNSAFLGVDSDKISTKKARILGLDNPHGIIIEKVVKNSAAARADLQPFDYLYRINDREFSENYGLTKALSNQKSGDEVVLYFIRKGESKSSKVNLGGQNDRNRGYTTDRSSNQRPFLGVSHVTSNDKGVVVNITKNSTAEELGMQNGDILTHINEYRIVDWGDITTALRTIRSEDKIVVNYISNGQDRRGAGTIRSNSNRNNSHIGFNSDRFEEKMERFGESMEDLGEEIEKNADVWAEKFAGKFEDAVSGIFDKDCNGCNENRYRNHNSAFLGVNSHKVSAEKASFLRFDNRYGSYIENVIDNTAAKNAKLQAFDYVYGIDEYRTGENQSLGAILHKYQPGDEAEVLFMRKGKKQRNAITFIAKSEARFSNIDECDEAFLGVRHVTNHTEGKVAVNPITNSTADLIGIKKDDIIKEINGFPIFDWSDVATGVDAMKPGETIKVSVNRNGKNLVVSGVVKSKRETDTSNHCNEWSNDDDDNDTNFSFDFDTEDDGVDFSFDFDTEDDNNRVSGGKGEARVNVDDMKVLVEDLTGADANNMRTKYGVDMPVVSNLQVTKVNVFPNPSMGMFVIKFNLPEQGDTAIRIFNSLGREIYNYELSNFSGEFEDNIDISQNGAGSYFLAITQNGKTMTKKIILQKR